MYLGILKIGLLWLSIVGFNEWLSDTAEYVIHAPVPPLARVLIDGLFLGVAVGQILRLIGRKS